MGGNTIHQKPLPHTQPTRPHPHLQPPALSDNTSTPTPPRRRSQTPGLLRAESHPEGRRPAPSAKRVGSGGHRSNRSPLEILCRGAGRQRLQEAGHMPSLRAGGGGQGSLQGGLPGAHGAPALPCWATGLPKSSAHTPCSGSEAAGRASWRRKRPGRSTERKEMNRTDTRMDGQRETPGDPGNRRTRDASVPDRAWDQNQRQRRGGTGKDPDAGICGRGKTRHAGSPRDTRRDTRRRAHPGDASPPAGPTHRGRRPRGAG